MGQSTGMYGGWYKRRFRPFMSYPPNSQLKSLLYLFDVFFILNICNRSYVYTSPIRGLVVEIETMPLTTRE